MWLNNLASLKESLDRMISSSQEIAFDGLVKIIASFNEEKLNIAKQFIEDKEGVFKHDLDAVEEKIRILLDVDNRETVRETIFHISNRFKQNLTYHSTVEEFGNIDVYQLDKLCVNAFVLQKSISMCQRLNELIVNRLDEVAVARLTGNEPLNRGCSIS